MDLEIACGSGTYIRAIARDLGMILQTGGTLAALSRTESCSFLLTDSLTLSDLENQLSKGIFQPISPDKVLQHLLPVSLPDTLATKWCQGQKIGLDLASGLVRVYQNERFLGIGQLQENILVPQMVYEAIG